MPRAAGEPPIGQGGIPGARARNRAPLRPAGQRGDGPWEAPAGGRAPRSGAAAASCPAAGPSSPRHPVRRPLPPAAARAGLGWGLHAHHDDDDEDDDVLAPALAAGRARRSFLIPKRRLIIKILVY
eukprot:scaffold1306_cov399-Prasinococcus_capsulatus_cf.AAC.3